MGREREGYRDMLSYLHEIGVPAIMTRVQVAEFLTRSAA